MFVISIDAVVYYLIRKGPLEAFKWCYSFVIEVTNSWDISKTKKTYNCLNMGAYFRVWLVYISFRSPSKMLSNGTSFNFVDLLLIEL